MSSRSRIPAEVYDPIFADRYAGLGARRYGVLVAMKAIQLFSIPVSDQARAKAFYVETLGWELVRDDARGPDQRWVQVKPPGGETSVTLVTWFETMPAGSLRGVVIETDDLERDQASLRERGVRVDSAIEEAPWGRWVTFDDPDGNGFVLQATAAREDTAAAGSAPAAGSEADRDLQDAFD
jgi:predicted enzyme related to lactoylglutathione lyase